MAAKAQAETLSEGIRKDGGTHRLVDRMQTRAELYATIGYHEYEPSSSSIITSITPEGCRSDVPIDQGRMLAFELSARLKCSPAPPATP